MELTYLAVGLIGGLISTLLGLGGGMVIILALSLLVGPRFALVVTAPALLLGSLHRFSLFRRHLDRRVARVFLLGAVPGTLLGSLLAVGMPEWVMRWLLVVATLAAVARALGRLDWTPGPRAIAPAGFVAGGVISTSGVGLLVAPILLAAGVRGDAFVATTAAVGATMHVTRLGGYAAGGLLTGESAWASLFVAVAVLLGNLAGWRIREALSETTKDRSTYVMMVLLVVLAVVGATG